MNFFRSRFALFVAAGLVGALLAVTLMPSGLDAIFRWLQELNTQATARDMPEEIRLDIVPETLPTQYTEARSAPTLVALGILGFIIGVAVANLALRVLGAWEKMDTGDRVTLILGIFAGFVVCVPFLGVIQNLPLVHPAVAFIITLILTVGMSGVSVMALRSVADVLPWQSQRGRGKRRSTKILDTNVIIDGRIYDLARTGFLEGELYVPQFVLAELQHIADSADSLRRQRGRRGLEVLKHLQSEFTVEVGNYDKLAGDPEEEVDARLVTLAKNLGGDLVSNDFNLNRVARIQQVRVLNVNDLALALRPNVLPGETLEVMIIREGNQPGQGVGYLDDGTMIVVEQGKPFLGENMPVNVTQVIQTERGKMIFAEVRDDAAPIDSPELPSMPRRSRRPRGSL